jgi:hypothetical protein
MGEPWRRPGVIGRPSSPGAEPPTRGPRFPCLAADDPELWKFDGLDTQSLFEQTRQLIDPRDENSCPLVENGYIPV